MTHQSNLPEVAANCKSANKAYQPSRYKGDIGEYKKISPKIMFVKIDTRNRKISILKVLSQAIS